MPSIDKNMFGQVFNGEERKKPVENPEKNTPKEQEVVDDIHKHLAFSSQPIPIDSAIIIQKILKTKEYSDLINKPTTRMVYRGMSISEENLILFGQKVGQTIDTKKYMVGIFDIESFSFIPKNERFVSSWTKKYGMGEEFATYISIDASENETKHKYSLVLGAQVAKNKDKFWDLQKWYEEIDPSLKEESEVVGFGAISVQWVKWFRNENT